MLSQTSTFGEIYELKCKSETAAVFGVISNNGMHLKSALQECDTDINRRIAPFWQNTHKIIWSSRKTPFDATSSNL